MNRFVLLLICSTAGVHLCADEKQLGVSLCVNMMWHDSGEIVRVADDFLNHRGKPQNTKVDPWISIQADKKDEQENGLSDLLAQNEFVGWVSPFVYSVVKSRGYTVQQTPCSTPAPSPSPQLSPLASRQRCDSTTHDPESSNSLDGVREDENYFLFVRPLVGKQNKCRSLLKPVIYANGDEWAMICNVVYGQDGKGKKYNICCPFGSVKKVPDFISLLDAQNTSFEGVKFSDDGNRTFSGQGACGSGRAEMEEDGPKRNNIITEFLTEIDGKWPPEMVKVDDIIEFIYKEKSIKATVTGVGTSTAVYRFGTFDGELSDRLNHLNEYLPQLAIRRLVFNEDAAKDFLYHQMAQICFYKERGVDFFPTKLLKTTGGGVFIVQPYLDEKNRLEHYFSLISKKESGGNDIVTAKNLQADSVAASPKPRISGDENAENTDSPVENEQLHDIANEEINICGKTISIQKFFRDVTKIIIGGVHLLRHINSNYKIVNNDNSKIQVLEAFCDAKFNNYSIAITADDELKLSYYDLVPAHIKAFGRYPRQSNGHTQYEIFDGYFQRKNGNNDLVKDGMVRSYAEKYNKYSNVDALMKKLGASGLELIFSGVSMPEALYSLNNKNSNERLVKLADLLVEAIKSSVAGEVIGVQVTMEEIIKYWEARVHKNMLLRLSLDFIKHISVDEIPSMPLSKDESILIDFVRSQYEIPGPFQYMRQEQDRGNLTPDVVMAVFDKLIKGYLNCGKKYFEKKYSEINEIFNSYKAKQDSITVKSSNNKKKGVSAQHEGEKHEPYISLGMDNSRNTNGYKAPIRVLTKKPFDHRVNHGELTGIEQDMPLILPAKRRFISSESSAFLSVRPCNPVEKCPLWSQGLRTSDNSDPVSQNTRSKVWGKRPPSSCTRSKRPRLFCMKTGRNTAVNAGESLLTNWCVSPDYGAKMRGN